MSLREYILRRQAHTRETMETVRLETLPLVNSWTEDTITLKDFYGGKKSMDEEDIEALEALKNDVQENTDEEINFDPVDKRLQQAKSRM